jgi:hypothetical protein
MSHEAVADVRADPDFGRLSQLVWEQLRDELASAQGFSAPRTATERVAEPSLEHLKELEGVGSVA